MKILFFGDSITDAGRSRDGDFKQANYGLGYVRAVAGALLSENPLKYQIINRGISGNRVVDLYARIKSDVWNLQPDVLSILIGVNDVWHELGSHNGVELDRFEKVYRMLIEDTKAKLPDVKLILLEPFVLNGTATQERYEGFLEVKKYAELVARLAKEYGACFVPLQEKLDEAAAKYGVEAYLSDGVHPAVAGSQLIAEEWLKVFKKELD